jgi:simple sugar transport system ATP-binding protein
LGQVPEDLTKHGLVVHFSIADNQVLNRFRAHPFSRRGLRDDGAIFANAESLVADYDIRTPSASVPVQTLSGGNQQKVIVARELGVVERLLIVAQPTRGLDVGSIEFIHRRIIEMRDAGAAVLLVSAELDEVLNLSDRVGIIYRGSLVGTFDRSEITREHCGLYMATGRGAVGASS